MNILALDLGTHTGFAYNLGSEFSWGTWTLGTPKEIRQWGKERKTRTYDPRIGKLCKKIGELGYFHLVVFEDVMFSTYTKQTQLWSALRAAVWLCADTSRFDCVPVSTLKLFATGKGNADKSMMSEALRLQHPGIWEPTMDDNAIDAIWAWCWAEKTYGRMKKL